LGQIAIWYDFGATNLPGRWKICDK
jgi:hypothetical protein